MIFEDFDSASKYIKDFLHDIYERHKNTCNITRHYVNLDDGILALVWAFSFDDIIASAVAKRNATGFYSVITTVCPVATRQLNKLAQENKNGIS